MDCEKGDPVMSGMHNKKIPRRITRICAGLIFLVMVLPVLTGCATGGKVSPAAVEQKPSEVKGASVTRLEDGREGFLLSEVPQMDEASRRDFERAVALLNKQDYSKAIDILAKIIEQSPGVTAPYINIAIAYQHIGKPEQAEEHLKTAIEMVPGHPAACNEYGLWFRKRGRFDEARAMYEKALEGFPDYYPVHRNLGILCDLYLNDLSCAIEHYQIYSQAMPEDRQVEIWITDLRARLGRE
jgi:Tfp pilus assembly protein PilF